MKKLKKIISIMLSFVLSSLIAVQSFAASQPQSFRYECPDGTIIQYYLNENGYPFVIKNGEQVPIALPLEHLKVTDESVLEQLNFGINLQNTRSAPSTYFNLTAPNNQSNSIKYTQVMSFLNTTTLPTQYIKFYPNHEALSIKTADIYKEHFYSSVKINFRWYYYTEYLDTWYYQDFTNVDCSLSAGKRIQHSPSINTFGKFEISKGNSGIESFVLEIWSTYTW